MYVGRLDLWKWTASVWKIISRWLKSKYVSEFEDGRIRWPRTDSGRYQCTHCDKTYARHTGIWKHFQIHHQDDSDNTCRKSDCSEARFDQFHLCDNHLIEHENKAREFIKRTYEINESGCWIFKGSTTKSGYAQCHSYNLHSKHSEVVIGAYKLSLYLTNRLDESHEMNQTPLAIYGDVHHICRTRNCINPDHLVEISENLHDVMHNLGNRRIAKLVLGELIEHYPHLEKEITSLRKEL